MKTLAKAITTLWREIAEFGKDNTFLGIGILVGLFLVGLSTLVIDTFLIYFMLGVMLITYLIFGRIADVLLTIGAKETMKLRILLERYNEHYLVKDDETGIASEQAKTLQEEINKIEEELNNL